MNYKNLLIILGSSGLFGLSGTGIALTELSPEELKNLDFDMFQEACMRLVQHAQEVLQPYIEDIMDMVKDF